MDIDIGLSYSLQLVVGTFVEDYYYVNIYYKISR